MGISVIIGAFTRMMFNFDTKLNLLASYRTDIIEGAYKSFNTENVMVCWIIRILLSRL